MQQEQACKVCGMATRSKYGVCGRTSRCKSKQKRLREKQQIANGVPNAIVKYREKNCEKKKRYKAKNREKVQERGKRRYAKNREKILEYAKRYRNKNRKKVLESERLYWAKNPDKLREKYRRRRRKQKEQKALQELHGLLVQLETKVKEIVNGQADDAERAGK